MRSFIAFAMSYVLMVTAAALPAAGKVTPEERVKQLKEQIAKIPTGAVIGVTLLNKQKFEGRLG